MAQVKDLMTRDVVTIDGGDTVLAALKLMVDRKVKSVVIPPRDGADPYGILTFSDIARKVIAADERVEMLNVYDLMTKPCIKVEQDWDIKYAARLMTTFNISRAIVTREAELLGIVSLTDLVASLLADK